MAENRMTTSLNLRANAAAVTLAGHAEGSAVQAEPGRVGVGAGQHCPLSGSFLAAGTTQEVTWQKA